jgi:hypothetical protein
MLAPHPQLTTRSRMHGDNLHSSIRLYVVVLKYSRKFNIFTTSNIAVLYGCETWSLTLREEHRLRVFENRVLKRIFPSKRDELTGEW